MYLYKNCGFILIKKLSFSNYNRPDLSLCLSFSFLEDQGHGLFSCHMPSCLPYTVSPVTALGDPRERRPLGAEHQPLPLPTSLTRKCGYTDCRRGAALHSQHRQSAVRSLLHSASTSPPSPTLTMLCANHGGPRDTFSSSGSSTHFSAGFVSIPSHTVWVLSSLSWLRLFSSLHFLSKSHLAGVLWAWNTAWVMGPAQSPSGSARGVRIWHTGINSPRNIVSSQLDLFISPSVYVIIHFWLFYKSRLLASVSFAAFGIRDSYTSVMHRGGGGR